VKRSEDEQLAQKVEGIDLIVSGHTHTTLTQPIVVGSTYIVSAGPYCQNLGSITLRWNQAGEKELVDYQLIPIDETLSEQADIAQLVEHWKNQVGGDYLGRYGLSYDQVLTTSAFDLNMPDYGVQQGNNLGELVSDAFLWATENLEQDAPNVDTIAVTAAGVLRAGLPAGDITVSQAFDVLSMGVGSDGTSGFPLVAVYLTGKELKAVAEMDASVTPIMPAAQLYLSGMTYSFNTHRMFFNRVTDAQLQEMSFDVDCGLRDVAEIDDNALYRVVTGMYSAQMLGTIKSKSLGLLSLEPKMADGSPVTDFEDCILRDANGGEIKEWYALAAYLASFGKDGVPSHYAAPDGRKNVSHSFSPIQLLKNPNRITLAVLLAVVVLAVILVCLAGRLRRRAKRRRYGGRSYRG
jgi:2',3'-cyclic-nucleotide 2'-phosphodiesterase (5'-nucleotidase family)